VDAPPLRSDAARNRERLLAAARQTFADQGLDVSMREIARQAGVSEPTLRRRFASKQELVAEAFEDKVAAYADAAQAALDHTDPWTGFVGFLEAVAGMQLVDRGFAEVLTLTFPSSLRCERERRRAYGLIQDMIARAQAAGSLRPDFVAEDVVLVLLAHAGVVAVTEPVNRMLSARLLAYLTETFAAPGRAVLPDPPSVARTYRALLRLHDTRSS
jgi:AcrR family transcriptional regulator